MSGQPAGDPLAELVMSYLDDHEVELRPDDTVREARVNTWAYGLPVGGFDVSAVAAALELVARRLSERLDGRRGTFYCWYDEQAGRLRCSLTSRLADQLPFGGRHQPVLDVAEVLHRAAGDPHPGVVLWEELSESAKSGDPIEIPLPPFPVWVSAIS